MSWACIAAGSQAHDPGVCSPELLQKISAGSVAGDQGGSRRCCIPPSAGMPPAAMSVHQRALCTLPWWKITTPWWQISAPVATSASSIHRSSFPRGRDPGFWIPRSTPRGTLSHWCIHRQDGKIKNYQCVVPSTWNAGPRDAKDQKGPYEASLVGNPIADPERPLEVLRTIHSFDPCLACAIHTHDPDGKERSKVRVR